MSYYEHRMQGETLLNDNLYDSHDRYSNEKALLSYRPTTPLN